MRSAVNEKAKHHVPALVGPHSSPRRALMLTLVAV